MHRLFNFIPALSALLFFFAGNSYAASIAVKPSNLSVKVGKTVQFSAVVSGMSSGAVTWSAGGVSGGSSKSGKITSTGSYTAPSSLPGQNPVLITATSAVNGQVKGSTYVSILGKGATITSVSPNPLPVGTNTVRISGSGFLAGATVFDSYGTNTRVKFSTKSVTSTIVKATGYQGPASSASFCVKNPGAVCSNSIVLTVGGGATPTPMPSASPSPGPSPSPSPVPSQSPSPKPTESPKPSPSPAPSASPSPAPSPSPSKSPSATPSPSGSPSPSGTRRRFPIR